MRVGVTGAYGLLGWHLCSSLKASATAGAAIEIHRAGREEFASAANLLAFVQRCDAIVHLAGMNRGDENEVAETNLRLTRMLVEACDQAAKSGHRVRQIAFSSSTHVDRGTRYGESKKACAEILSAWASRSGGKFCNFIFPNVFGERGKPFYNSVVSTFCHQVANGEEPQIQVDAEMDQLHAQEASDLIEAALQSGAEGEQRPHGRKIRVTELLMRLREFDRLYRRELTVPDLRDGFDRDLFNTYRSYLYPQHYAVKLQLRTDPRGSLFESTRDLNGGQTFVSTTKPGITRGNHYHRRKIERFCVLSGEAKIQLRRLWDGEVREFRVSGAEPCFIDMPTLHTHNITNVGSGELVTLFWSNEIFDSQRPDTYAEPVVLKP